MKVTDPVCAMSIEDSDAVGKAEHDGTTYYFCSESCQEEFEANQSDRAAVGAEEPGRMVLLLRSSAEQHLRRQVPVHPLVDEARRLHGIVIGDFHVLLLNKALTSRV